jgi:hypothetical protein
MNAAARRAASILALVLLVLPLVLTAHFSFARWTRRVRAKASIEGTTPTGHNVDRVGVGTGVYSLGAPRQIEFGLRLTF